MNRNDWVYVGVRLFGLYLLVKALTEVVGVLRNLGDRGSGWLVFDWLILAAIGVLLFFGATALVGWITRKDGTLSAMAQAARQGPA